jgi:hypothetical protein
MQIIVCPCCKKPQDFDGYQLLRVSAELGWFSSGGSTTEASMFSLDGLCGDCGDKLYNGIANLLRESAGVPALTLEQEVEAMDAESNDDANPLPEAEEDTDALP